jgi:hypothetical protein
MRIALLVGDTYHWLAGQPEVSMRTHSWAADFTLTPQSAVQVAEFVRAAVARPIDRANLLREVTFSTTRQFASPAAAELWALDYDTAFPRSGTLVFEAVAPNGVVTRRRMLTSVVSPPVRRVRGATVLLDYRVQGGLVESASDFGDLTVSGGPFEDSLLEEPFTWGTLIYHQLTNTRPEWTSTGAAVTSFTGGKKVFWNGTAWKAYFYRSSFLAYEATSADDVATPDLVTTWTTVEGTGTISGMTIT